MTRRLAPKREPREGRWFAYGALLIAILGIAWSAIFIRWAAVPGPSSAFYRVLIAALVLVPWRAMLPSRPRRRTSGRAVLLALGAGAFFGFDLALYNTAVLRTTAATATLMGNNAPIFVGIGAWLLFKRRPQRAFWIGLTLALAGAAIVMFAGLAKGGAARGDRGGDLLALAASVFFAGYMLLAERVRDELDTLTFSTIAIVGSVATLVVVCLLLDAPLAGFSGRTWAALFGLGFISQLAAYFALAYALGHLPATITAVSLLAQVPLTALLAVMLLHEPLTVPQIAGGILVLAGIYVVNRGSD